MSVPQPPIITKLLPGRAGRGRPNGFKPVLLVMHIQEGTNDLYDYFQTVAADSTIWNPPGDNDKLVRLLNDTDTAWTNGQWAAPINLANPVIADLNRRYIDTNDVSLTIEHAGYPNRAITAAQLERSAQICAWWCERWNIPPDRNHIIGHYEVGPHKGCPGPLFPFDRLVARVQEIIRMSDNFDPNPKGYSVGTGMLTKLREIRQAALTPERYTSDSSSQLVASGGYVLFANKTATGPEWEVVAIKGQ